MFVKTEHPGEENAVIEQLQKTRPDVVYKPWQTLQSTVKELTGSFDSIRSILNAVSLLVAAIAVFIITYIDRRTGGAPSGSSAPSGSAGSPSR